MLSGGVGQPMVELWELSRPAASLCLISMQWRNPIDSYPNYSVLRAQPSVRTLAAPKTGSGQELPFVQTETSSSPAVQVH
mmetsp:Transcript_117046/g.164533  ORF Transcript_117046/g.164533 Transcript_117046/m.164533 type:complete len:80 (+) Transcript_117046:133-372(+)